MTPGPKAEEEEEEECDADLKRSIWSSIRLLLLGFDRSARCERLVGTEVGCGGGMWTCGTGAPRPPRPQQRFNDKQDWHVPTRVDPHTQHVAHAARCTRTHFRRYWNWH